ncbi:MAG: hypothetical protein COA58_13910 [Bacteroidetes bacterium]|nr:MAG: hypothetical protein COA58_13910 [Bacteroidota bacterium]
MKKMKIKNILLVGVLSLFSIACVDASDSEMDAKGYSISVQSDLAEKTLVVLSKITDVKLETLDSAYVSKDGSFSFKGEGSEESTIYYLTLNGTTPPGIPVILENGAKVKIELTSSNGYDIVMSGGKYNHSMLKLYNIYTGFEKDMNAFNAEVALIDPTTVNEELRSNTTKRYTSMIKARSEGIENFIKTEEGSPVTYFAVKYLFQKMEPKLILLGSEKLNADLPESSYAANLDKLAKELGPTVVGAVAPEINLKTPEGEALALSSLRGQVVLLDFWASWCGPCRKENPHVKKVYEKYKDKGFEIYAVSLDNNKSHWQGAIAKDGLPWKHVSDLVGWKSSAAKVYNVHSIPQTFLLDKDGRIVSTGFRSNELEPLLESLLQ